jgi:DNA helicase-2/ATP-dependent DNA helicase PcrA
MELDAGQRRAVEFYKGQAIVIAGAGSGKTRCTTERIGRLVERGEAPESILAFTFTNAAADEMKARLVNKIGKDMVDRLNIGTMHSQLNRILRKNIQFWKPDMHQYEIMQDNDCRKLIQEAMKACDLPEDNMVNIANATAMISYVKNNAISLEDVKNGCVDGVLHKFGVDTWFVDFFVTYEALRRAKRFIGFDDMLWETYFLLREKVNILNTYADMFKFVLVDEFQDTNRVQFELVKMLQSKHKNLFVVGDPRQAIYGFRSADVTLSLEFAKHFEGAEIIELEHNYRCASNIVEMSNDLIAKAGYPFARTKSLKQAGKIDFLGGFLTVDEEAEAIAEEIKQLHTDGVRYSDIIVLTRTNAQSRSFEEKFIKNRIPYKSLDGTFYESANVKDMLSYLELLVSDSMEAFKRIYNRPNRFLGKVFLETFEQKMKRGGGDFLETLRGGGFPKSFMNKNASAFAAELYVLRSNAAHESSGKAIGMIRKVFGYDEWLKKNEVDAANRIEILNELQSSADGFTSITEYLEFVKNIVAEQRKAEDFDAVRIMTIHRSKGLEARVVFAAGFSEGVLPHARSEDVEEERRLAYVALTRAIERLYVSYFLMRFNKELAPSRFLFEMSIETYTGKKITPDGSKAISESELIMEVEQ